MSLLDNLRELRRKMNMTQSEFWGSIGVTQSGGSRYESDSRKMPKQVAEIARLKHIEQVDPAQITGDTAEVLRLIQSGKLSASVVLEKHKNVD